MKLYVPPMDAFVVEVTDDGLVRVDSEEARAPSLQEKRAILFAAHEEMGALAELVAILERKTAPPMT